MQIVVVLRDSFRVALKIFYRVKNSKVNVYYPSLSNDITIVSFAKLTTILY